MTPVESAQVQGDELAQLFIGHADRLGRPGQCASKPDQVSREQKEGGPSRTSLALKVFSESVNARPGPVLDNQGSATLGTEG